MRKTVFNGVKKLWSQIQETIWIVKNLVIKNTAVKILYDFILSDGATMFEDMSILYDMTVFRDGVSVGSMIFS